MKNPPGNSARKVTLFATYSRYLHEVIYICSGEVLALGCLATSTKVRNRIIISTIQFAAKEERETRKRDVDGKIAGNRKDRRRLE